MKMSLGVCFVVAALAATALITFAQQEQPTIKVEVRQVLVPVVVTDRAGHHVTGLKAGDFRVYEDGVEQQVVSFGTELSATLPAAGEPLVVEPALAPETPLPASIHPAPIRRTYLVLFDSLFMSFDSAGRLRKALPKLFAQEQGGDSQYALVALGRDLRIVRSITRKPEEILAAAESDALPRAIRESSGGNFAGQESQLRSILDKYCRQCECVDNSPPTGRPTILDSVSPCEVLFENMERWAAAAARERSAAYRNFLMRLAEIIRLTGQQPGKRIMIMASDGLDLWPGRDLYTLIATYTNRPTFPMRNPTVRLEHELDAVARAATTSDVVVYTIDTRGIPPPTAGVFSAENQGGRFVRRDAGRAISEMVTHVSLIENSRQDTLSRLADVTGGVFFRGNSDLAKGMHQAFADEREYYVLAYAPANRAEDGNFRKVRVALKDKKLKVRAKAGYWAPSQGAKP
jgi:VWFA-related protein